MKCKIVRRRLPAYADGRLNKRELGRIDAHLAKCESCRKQLREHLQLADLLRSTRGFQLSPGFANLVWGRIEEGERSFPRKQIVPRWLPRVLVPAACVAALTLGVFLGEDLQQMRATTRDYSGDTLLVSTVAASLEELPGNSITSGYLTLVDVENGS
jgi:anti-sigma factor RsiW